MDPFSLAALDYDIAHLSSALVLVAAFAPLYQRRLPGMVNLFALQSAALGTAAVLQRFPEDSPAWKSIPTAVAISCGIGLLCGLFNGALFFLITIMKFAVPAFLSPCAHSL